MRKYHSNSYLLLPRTKEENHMRSYLSPASMFIWQLPRYLTVVTNEHREKHVSELAHKSRTTNCCKHSTFLQSLGAISHKVFASKKKYFPRIKFKMIGTNKFANKYIRTSKPNRNWNGIIVIWVILFQIQLPGDDFAQTMAGNRFWRSKKGP